jgi:hypothetical protein
VRLLLLNDRHINLPDADVGYAVMDVTESSVASRTAST